MGGLLGLVAWVLVGLLAVLLIGLLRELHCILRAQAPAQAALRILNPAGSADATPALTVAPIPRVIWAYWHQQPPPEFVQRCLANWHTFAPDHEVRCLDADSIRQWLTPESMAAMPANLPDYRMADWLRLQLLQAHGGIWMDASTLLTRDLEWVHTLQREHEAEFVGFYIDGMSRGDGAPIVENWFLAAPPHSPFIQALAAEFGRALGLGEAVYLEHLRAQGRFDACVQAMPERFHEYLIMHVAASAVLQASPKSHRLVLQRAEDTAFAFHSRMRWRKKHLYIRLALTRRPSRVPALIKLRGPERRVIERGLSRGWLRKQSLLAQLLTSDPR